MQNRNDTHQITINTLQPEAGHLPVLIPYLKTLNPERNALAPHEAVNPVIINGQKYAIKLSHRILARESDSNPGEIRYEVLSNEALAGAHVGSYGRIENVEATIEICTSETLDIKTHNPRVVKVQQSNNKLEESFIIKEEEMMRLAGHLKSKHISTYSLSTPDGASAASQYAITMGKAPGTSLKKYLSANRKNSMVIKRFNLTIALLKAYKEQIHRKKIMHKDIKPENMNVEEKDGCFNITYLDLGFAEKYSAKNVIPAGTAYYLPPEYCIRKRIIPEAYDLFPLGVTIAATWNDSIVKRFYKYSTERICFEIMMKGYKFTSLIFEDILPHSDVHTRNEIRSLIKALTNFNPHERINIDGAIDLANRLRLDYLERGEDINLKKIARLANAFYQNCSQLNNLEIDNILHYRNFLQNAIIELPEVPTAGEDFNTMANLGIPKEYLSDKQALREYINLITLTHILLRQKMRNIANDLSYKPVQIKDKIQRKELQPLNLTTIIQVNKDYERAIEKYNQFKNKIETSPHLPLIDESIKKFNLHYQSSSKLNMNNVTSLKSLLREIIDEFPEEQHAAIEEFLARINWKIPRIIEKSKANIIAYLNHVFDNYLQHSTELESILKRLNNTLKYEESTEKNALLNAYTDKIREQIFLPEYEAHNLDNQTSRKLKQSLELPVNTKTLSQTATLFRAIKQSNDIRSQRVCRFIAKDILFSYEFDKTDDDVIRLKNSIRLAMLRYINETTSDKNILKKHRSYSDRRKNKLVLITELLSNEDDVKKLRKRIKFEMMNIETGFFGRSLLRNYIQDALDRPREAGFTPTA